MIKIPCGGFYIDDETLDINEDGKLSVIVIPTVTSSDNGKVLQVVNGAWAAVSIPSASGVSF